jgi:hypothetical protein
MAMQYDVQASTISSSGSVYGARTRVKSIVITPTSTAGSVVLRDGGASGTSRITINTTTSTVPFTVMIPGEGVLFSSTVYGTLTNVAAITVFYG